MGWSDSDSPEELQKAFRECRFADADALIAQFLSSLDAQPRRIDAKVAKEILSPLRSYARFEQLSKVAALIKKGGQTEPHVLRQLAQAQIEEGDITGAIEELTALKQTLEERRDNPRLDSAGRNAVETELSECLGLLGRAYKQLYVDASPRPAEPRQGDLDRAMDYYRRAFSGRIGDCMRHGINYIALLTRAERVRKGQPNTVSEEAENYAGLILQSLDELDKHGPLHSWDAANRAEALLACGNNPEAIEAIQQYLETPGLDAFAIQSTRRQLEQVWLLSPDSFPGSDILPMMTARFAELGGGREDVDLTAVNGDSLERIWDDTRYRPIQWLLEAVDRRSCVARLGPDVHEGWGTGFLFDGAWIDDRWKDRHLLLTNAHVCTSDAEVRKRPPYPAGPSDTKAAFLEVEAKTQAQTDVLGLIWTSPPSDLDATLLEIAPPPEGAKAPPLSDTLPSADGDDPRVNILGHPRGLGLRVSMQGNRLVSVDDRYLHYRTPTDAGSSGSPIFDQNWRLVGLHHSSSRTKRCNEGIRLDCIVDAIRRQVLGSQARSAS